MASSHNIDLLGSLKKLMAENHSQAARLEEYAKIIKRRDTEIEMLQAMLSEANEFRSSLDNQLSELTELRHYIEDLQQQVSGASFMVTGSQQQVAGTVSVAQQLQKLTLEYAYLQSQLPDLQTQLLDANDRNLLLQQQNSRIPELESLLANAEQEMDQLKKKR